MRENSNYDDVRSYDDVRQTENGFGTKVRDGITFLLVGGGIGAILALLFAPKSGNELRSDIADVTRKGLDATKEKADQLKTRSIEAVEKVKHKADEVYGKASEAASETLNTGLNAGREAVSATSEAVSDAISDVQREADLKSNRAGAGQKSTGGF